MHAMFLVGYIVSAVAALTIAPAYGWRSTFLVTLLVIPLILLLYVAMPESDLWNRLSKEEKEMGVPLRTGIQQVFNAGLGKLLVLATLLFWAAEFAYHAIVDWGPHFLQFAGTTNTYLAQCEPLSLVSADSGVNPSTSSGEGPLPSM